MLFLFFRSLRHRWLEYLLSTAVIAVAAATLMVQRSLSSSTENQIHDLAHELGKNMLVVPESTDLYDFYSMQYDSSALPDSYPERIQASDLSRHISFIQARLYGNMKLSSASLIIAGEKNYKRRTIHDPVPAGKVLLGNTAASRLGLKQHDLLEIKGLQLTVDGVSTNPPGGLDVGVFTSLGVAQEIFDKPGEINSMRLAGCWCSLDVPTLASQVEQQLPGSKSITIAGMIKAQKAVVTTVKRYSAVIHTVALFLIAGIVSILISSQVRRQVREIGLLLAIGTAPSFITLSFIIKAGLVGFIGGLLGYLLGFPLTQQITSILIGVPLQAHEGLLVTVLALPVMVSVLSALLPAIRAAKLDPTEILREV